MPRELEVDVRGDELTIVVDQYEYDPETNGLDVEWHFKHLTPEQTTALALTDKEEDSIVAQIGEYIDEGRDSDELEPFDYHEDR